MKGGGVWYGTVVLEVRVWYRTAHCTEIKLCCSLQHNSSSVYSALSDNMGGHLWANKLLITCRVIKVIPLYICFHVSYLSEISFHLQQCSINIKFVCMACEFLLRDVALCMQWTCGINFNCTSLAYNRKYSNSYTINDEYRQTVDCVDFRM